jgi:LmbE family N-acetylglucosaminyl deacetylase
MKKCLAFVFILGLLLPLSARAQQGQIPNMAELEIALRKLNVLGSALFIGAHPDDENSSVLAYLSKGRGLRAAYLSVTRGEGGQNLIGSEKGAEIGLLRTQELMSARRVDGAEQFFTRAVDFGYSKTAEETFEFWGREKILGDVVWVIRTFRPDVILTRFTPENAGGHGHHIAAGLLTKEAFVAAADPKRFPEQLKYVSVWKAKRLLWNTFRSPQGEAKVQLRVDTGSYNPWLGKSYTEMAGESRSQHKSQGTGSAGRRGTQFDSFELMDGDPATTDIFEGVDVTWNRVPGGRAVGDQLAEVLKSFEPEHPSKSIPGLLGVYTELTKLGEEPWVRTKKNELLRVLQACAGLWMEAIAADYAAAPGDAIQVRTTLVNRSDQPMTLHSLGIPSIAPDDVLDRSLKNNEPVTIEKSILIPKDYPLSQPYWLEAPRPDGFFFIRGQNVTGLAENPPAVEIKLGLDAGGKLLEYFLPLSFRWTDQAEGELYRLFEVRPPLTLQVEEKVSIFANENPKKIKVKLKSHSPNIAGQVRLKGPDAWKISPISIPFSLPGKYDEGEVTFDVIPPKFAVEADLTAEAEFGGEKSSRAFVEISYPHIHRQDYFPGSRIRVVKLDVKTLGKKAGYIMGAGDEVPDALRNLGYEVVQLSDEMLENADFSQFDAMITGVRAYNTRDRLRQIKDKILQYVERGGNLVVQYNVPSPQLANRIGPYPLTVGRDRVNVEDAPVTFLAPGHPLLNVPNKITPKDFDGWVQERGLYYATQWDDKYEAILSSHDPGEPDKNGGLLYARYGQGVFIYTALAWFRQLPDGVPGAYRLFANLISAGKTTGKRADGKN